MRQLYTYRKIAGMRFILAEHLNDSVSAAVAAFEYRCEGFYCRLERDDDHKVFYVWVGPQRQRQVRTLPGEVVKRDRPGSHVPRARVAPEKTSTRRSHMAKVRRRASR